MKTRTIFALGWLVILTLFPATSRADDRRFSSSLNATESAQTGLARLTSDETAVLDALVRNDSTLFAADPTPASPRPALFSQRLSAEERRNAGLTRLNESEVAKLNVDVEQFVHPVAPATGAGSDLSTSTSLTSVMLRRDPEIHGTISFMIGAGSHGYSEYGGGINLTYYDPAHHFALDVGYSEIHSTGGVCNRLFPGRQVNQLPP
jgi:hypothetical protein